MVKLAFILLPFFAMAQNLSLTQNISLGHDCGNGTHQTFNYNDVNLNGYTIELRNAILIVNGNLNGSGQITKCGNQNNSFVCVSGAIQNNPNLNGLSCNNLSNEEFTFTKNNYKKQYTIFNLLGEVIKTGTLTQNTYNELQTNTLYIVKVSGFKTTKIIKL